MLCVTRYNAAGKVHHTCLADSAELLVDSNGKVCVNMPPYRYWQICDGGKIEIMDKDNKAVMSLTGED